MANDTVDQIRRNAAQEGYKVQRLVPAKEAFGGSVSSDVLSVKHPEVEKRHDIWQECTYLVNSAEKNYEHFMFDLPNEKVSSKTKRKKHFARGFRNPAQRLLGTVAEFIYRKKVRREGPDLLETWWDNVDGNQSINDFMRAHGVPNLRGYGSMFAVIDKPRDYFPSKAQEQRAGMPYMIMLSPLQVINFGCHRNELTWFRYWVTVRDENAPFAKDDGCKKYYYTWTKTELIVHDEQGRIMPDMGVVHNLGIVPVAVQGAFIPNNQLKLGNPSFFTTRNYIVIANNLYSVGNNEIFKFGSAILVANQNDWERMIDSAPTDADDNTQHITWTAKEVSDLMTVNDMAQKPEYLTKDLDVVDISYKSADEYMLAAIDNEGIIRIQEKAESGDAKRYDREEQEAMLAGTAQDLEAMEHQIAKIVLAWLGQSNADFTVQYERQFDVRSFGQALAELASLYTSGYPSITAKKEAAKNVIAKITNNTDKQQEIADEIEAADFENKESNDDPADE